MLEFLETFDGLITYIIIFVVALFASFERRFAKRVTNLLWVIVIMLAYIADKL